MTAAPIHGFSNSPSADRNAFLVFVALVWLGILSGFGTDSFDHLSKHGLDYPLIVHVHAVVFVGWLILFTVQVSLIRTRRADIHRRLGLVGAGLAAAMVVLGPATALVVDASDFAVEGKTPEFLVVQLTTVLAFAGLTGAGLWLRAYPSAHKRLMLIGLIYLSGPGFARYFNGLFTDYIGTRFWSIYLGSDLLILGLGAYDLITRRRLHPAYVLGASGAFVVQLLAVLLLHNPVWKALSLRIIGH